jgi:hypothetical protein
MSEIGQKCTFVFTKGTRYSCLILEKFQFSQQIFPENTQIPNLIKIRPVGSGSFLADRLTDRHDEANSRSSEFCDAPLGFPGSLLVSLGHSWFLWVPLGFPGSLLVSLGPSWFPWVTLGFPGSLLDSLGPSWFPWVTLGFPGSLLVSLGHSWFPWV